MEHLHQHDLIDTYRLMVFPMVLGSGRRLFSSGTGSSFTLVSSHTPGTGVLVLSYERVGKAS